jgi:hypothetical protein
VPDLDPQLVDRAVTEATKRAANLDYFFDNLKSGDWIQPLQERGLFSEPPTQVIDEQGYVRAPAWSASRYLARAAATSPAEVLRVIVSIDTDNERVHEDFVGAALGMPREQAREIACREAVWLSNRDYMYYLVPEKLTDLAVEMAGVGEVEAALDIVRALFTPTSSVGLAESCRRDSSQGAVRGL